MKKRETDALNLMVPRHEPPPNLEDKIMAAIQSSPRVKRTTPWVPLLAAATLALAVGNVAQLMLSQTPQVAASSLAAGAAPETVMADGTAKSGLEVVMMNGTAEAPKAFGTIVLDLADNHGVLAVRDLPASSGRYELWVRTATERRSAGVFEVNSEGYGALDLNIPADFRGFTEFRLCPRGTKIVYLEGNL